MKELKILPNTIVFEGLDGAGTTTQRNKLVSYLKEKKVPLFETCEPTNNMIGRLIRDILQKKYTTTPSALALLYSADRDDHLYNNDYGLLTQIEKGNYIIQDRYFYSSFAYQGVNLAWEKIEEINSFPHPEYVIYIETSEQVCMDRIEKRGEAKELFEKAEFLKKVAINYEKIFSTLPKEVKFLKIDCSLSVEAIFEEILKFLNF